MISYSGPLKHFIGQCPMHGLIEVVSEIADRFSLRKIVGYICSNNRFNQQ